MACKSDSRMEISPSDVQSYYLIWERFQTVPTRLPSWFQGLWIWPFMSFQSLWWWHQDVLVHRLPRLCVNSRSVTSMNQTSIFLIAPFMVNHVPHLWTEEISVAGQDFHLRMISNGIRGINRSANGGRLNAWMPPLLSSLHWMWNHAPWEPSKPFYSRNLSFPLSTSLSFCHQLFSFEHCGQFWIMTCSRPSIMTNPSRSHGSEWAPLSFAMRSFGIHIC